MGWWANCPRRAVSAFAGSDLAADLTSHRIDTVVMVGVPTTWAEEGIAWKATDRSYKIVAVEDCCASGLVRRHATAVNSIQ